MKKSKLIINDFVSLQSLSGGMAGDPLFFHRFLIGKGNIIKEFNLKAIVSKNALKGIDFINNNPQKRAEDLINALQDPKIKGIIANIGGVDSALLYQFLDVAIINAHPKFLIGYSDITAIHLMFYQAGVQTYYGPTVLDGFAENMQMHNITKNSFFLNAFSNEEQIITSAKEWTSQMLSWANKEYDYQPRKMIVEKHGFIWKDNITGVVQGHLLGGNLDTLIKITTAKFFPKLAAWKNAIIFLETSENKMAPVEFEKALILLGKQITFANGVIFGKPKDETYFEEYLEIIKRIIKKPFVYNLNFGHTAPMITIPYGAIMKIDFDNKKIIIT